MSDPLQSMWALSQMDKLPQDNASQFVVALTDHIWKTLSQEQRSLFADAFSEEVEIVLQSAELVVRHSSLLGDVSTVPVVEELKSSAALREIFASPRSKSPSGRQPAKPAATQPPPAAVKKSRGGVYTAAIAAGVASGASALWGSSAAINMLNSVQEVFTRVPTYDAVVSAYKAAYQLDTARSTMSNLGLIFSRFQLKQGPDVQVWKISNIADFPGTSTENIYVSLNLQKWNARLPVGVITPSAVPPAKQSIWRSPDTNLWDTTVPRKQAKDYFGSFGMLDLGTFFVALALAIGIKLAARWITDSVDPIEAAKIQKLFGVLGAIMTVWQFSQAALQYDTNIVPLLSMFVSFITTVVVHFGSDVVISQILPAPQMKIRVVFEDESREKKTIYFPVPNKNLEDDANTFIAEINERIFDEGIYDTSGGTVEYKGSGLPGDWSETFPTGTKVRDLKLVRVRCTNGDELCPLQVVDSEVQKPKRGQSPTGRQTIEGARIGLLNAQTRGVEADTVRKDNESALRRELADVDTFRKNWVAQQDADRKTFEANERQKAREAKKAIDQANSDEAKQSLRAAEAVRARNAAAREVYRKAQAKQALKNAEKQGELLTERLNQLKQQAPAPGWIPPPRPKQSVPQVQVKVERNASDGRGGPDRRSANPYDRRQVVDQESEQEEDESSGEYQEYSSAHSALAATGGNVQKAAAKLAQELLLL